MGRQRHARAARRLQLTVERTLRVTLAVSILTLAACSQSPNDPCALLPDARETIGLPVTATKNSQEGRSTSCTWKSAEGRLCGSATVVGRGWLEVPDIQTSYLELSSSMSLLGSASIVTSVGDEAVLIDAGPKGVSLVFREDDKVAVVVSACNGHSLPNAEFARRLGREIAGNL